MFWVHLEIVTQQMRQTREQTIICKVEGTEVCALCMCLSTYIVGWNLQMIVLEIMKRFALALLHLAALVHRLFFIDIWCSFCNTFVSSFSLMFFVFFLDINIEQIALNYTCLMSDLCSQWEGLYCPVRTNRGLCHVRPSAIATQWPVFVSPSFTGCQVSLPIWASVELI